LSHRDPGRETASGEKRANRDDGPPAEPTSLFEVPQMVIYAGKFKHPA
jgi:hypothetical protein